MADIDASIAETQKVLGAIIQKVRRSSRETHGTRCGAPFAGDFFRAMPVVWTCRALDPLEMQNCGWTPGPPWGRAQPSLMRTLHAQWAYATHRGGRRQPSYLIFDVLKRSAPARRRGALCRGRCARAQHSD